MKSVVVTGATSMMGSALIRSLINHDVQVIYAIIQRNTKNRYKIPADERIHCIYCDCEEYERIPELISGPCDTFYHFAWMNSKNTGRERYYDVDLGYRNIGQSIKALSSAARLGCTVFIGAGSQAEYGNTRNDLQAPDDPTDPVTAYGIAKDSTRRMCMLKAKEYDITVRWVRIFSVYGPHDRKNTMISSVLPKLLRNEDICLTDCQQLWDYLYEDDAGEGMYYAGLSKASGSNVYCLGSGHARPLREYIEEMKLITGSGSKLQYGSLSNAGDVKNLHADISRLKADTGWNGPQVSFTEGISSILAFSKAEHI